MTMSFRVRIIRKLWESITNPAELDDILLFYGFYAKSEDCTYLLEMQRGKGKLQEPIQVPLKKDNLDLLGWGFVQDPKYNYVSFENFKVQTHMQDIIPYSVMMVLGTKPQNEIKAMRIHELKLEKVPFTIVNEGDRVYDKFLEEQKNLAKFTDSDIFTQKKEYPVTKRDMVTEILDEMREKMVFLEKHGKRITDYPDLESAFDLADEGLYGRAGFYLRLVQKKIEDDVVAFRYMDKYEQLLKDMKRDIGSLPSKDVRPDLGDNLALIEQLIERADSLYYEGNYREAHSKLFKAHEHLLQILGRRQEPVEEKAAEETHQKELEPILTIEEFESNTPMFDPLSIEDKNEYSIETHEDIGERIEFLEKKRKEDPYNKNVLGDLGDAYFEAGDIHKSLECYKLQLKKTPSDPILLNNIGMIYKLQFNYKSAMEYFKKAIENDPAYSEAYYNLGFLYFEEGDLSEAIDNYKAAIELDPDFNLAKDSLNVAMRKKEQFMRQQNLVKREDLNKR